jgi:hypothetical protein
MRIVQLLPVLRTAVTNMRLVAALAFLDESG